MEHLKLRSLLFFFLALHYTLAQQNPSYGQQSQTKVQLEDIEQDNLKNAQQQTSSQASSSPQYAQYTATQNQPQFYSLQPQQQAAPVAAGQQQAQPVGVPLFALPQQSGAFPAGPPQQFIYFTQAPQTLSPYELPFYSGTPYVQQGSLNEYYKSLQTAAAAKPGQTAPVPAAVPASVPASLKAVPQVPVPNYYLAGAPLQQPYYQPISLSGNSPYLTYNPYYQVQAAQKSAFSAGIKSTTPAVPTKTDEKFVPIGNQQNYRFEYTSPDFTKLRG